jgi:hypothetical protein
VETGYERERETSGEGSSPKRTNQKNGSCSKGGSKSLRKKARVIRREGEKEVPGTK